MTFYLTAYICTAIVFLAIDFVWLSAMGDKFYKPRLGGMMRDNPNIAVAGLFYLFYAVGVVVFAVVPGFYQESYTMAALYGALFGFCAYGTYDFTNLSTLNGWKVSISLVDCAWGTFLTALSAVLGMFLTNMILY